jgi:hypothetical protein
MLEEQVVLDDDTRLELRLRSRADYRLACVRGGRVLVEYRSGDRHEFRSVEKLRYDFERDVDDALRQG